MGDQKTSNRNYVYQEGIVSIFVNLGLFAIKLWAGIMSSSVALIADAWHTLSDSLSSLIVIAGARLSKQKPNKTHPFGHGRWEYITTFLVSIFLGFISFEFFHDSIINLINKEEANFGTLAIVVTIISIIGKEALAQYALRIAKITGSSTVKADAWHHRTDALSSVIVLVGIFLKDVIWWVDSALGIIVAIVILYAAYVIIKESISKIIGEDLCGEELEDIMMCIAKCCDIEVNAHHFHLHRYGHHHELTFHIKLDPNITIAEGHRIATILEIAIKEKFGYVSTIHMEELER